MLQGKKNKIAFLNGLMTGTKSINELLNPIRLAIISYDNLHKIYNQSTGEVLEMNDKEFGQWNESKAKLPNPIYIFHII